MATSVVLSVAFMVLASHSAFARAPKLPPSKPPVNFDEVERGLQRIPDYYGCGSDCGIEVALQRPLPVQADAPTGLASWCGGYDWCDTKADFHFLKRGHQPTSLEADFISLKLEELKRAKFEVPAGNTRMAVSALMKPRKFLVRSDSTGGTLKLEGHLFLSAFELKGLSYLSHGPYFSHPSNVPTDPKRYCRENAPRDYLPCFLNRAMEATSFRTEFNGSADLIHTGVSAFPESVELPIQSEDGRITGKMELGVTWKGTDREVTADVREGPIYYTRRHSEYCPVDQPVHVLFGRSVAYNLVPARSLSYLLKGFELSDEQGLVLKSSAVEKFKSRDVGRFEVFLQDGAAKPASCVKRGGTRCLGSKDEVPSDWIEVDPDSQIARDLASDRWSCPRVGSTEK
ncbi:MAG: hypothetical protein NDJ89_01885 [Oligoflexia bacterium]|nr:hypothetical protein [Oligoflexia bacterium]